MFQLLYDQTLNKEASSYEETFRLKEVLDAVFKKQSKVLVQVSNGCNCITTAVAVDFITEVPSKTCLQNAL